MLDLEQRVGDLHRAAQSVDAVDGAQICVIFATRGRPALLARTVAAMARQTHRPTSIIVSSHATDDSALVDAIPGLRIVHGANGLAAQRNAALRQVPPGAEIVVFFDDDFVPRADWLEQVAAIFAREADIGAITGDLLEDGIKGPGLSIAYAQALLARAPTEPRPWVKDAAIPYGCNMAFRWSAIEGRAFDERLVLYGWLEDRDFGASLEQSGFRIVKTGTAIGVHLGVKSGRVSGRRLGYSQVVNPLYLARKGTMPLRAVADHLFRNCVSNLVLALRPEPHVDRRGRLYGNLRAFLDILRGCIDPERAAQL